MTGLLMFLMFAIALFLILVVLVQRGRGGGLAGAFGGMGGQSAFGTKAGDLFTRITIVVAFVWILLCMACVKYFNLEDTFESSPAATSQTAEQGKSPDAPVGGATPPSGNTGDRPAASDPPAGEAPVSSPPADSEKK